MALMTCNKTVSTFTIYLLKFVLCICTIDEIIAVKLGEHSPPSKGVTVLPGTFPNPIVFYKHFVSKGEPLLMKNVLPDSGYQAYNTWTDEHLRSNYGSMFVHIEKGKKEDRSRDISSIGFGKFLDLYMDIDLYMVYPVQEGMADEVEIPFTLQCGGFQKNLHDSVIWFSGGDTKSVLHYDAADNILCVLDGIKQVVLIDKKHAEKVKSSGFVEKGAYSQLDVDNVDPEKFDHILSLPWVQANITKGDCLYIPYKWFHQVYSPPGRNLAINSWFSHLWWFNETDCQGVERGTPFKTLIQFGFASPNEQLRTEFLEPFETMETVNYEDFMQESKCPEQEDKDKLWKFINTDGDDHLTWPEMYTFSMDELVMSAPQCFLNAADMEDAFWMGDDLDEWQEAESDTEGGASEGAPAEGGAKEGEGNEGLDKEEGDRDNDKTDDKFVKESEKQEEDLDLIYVKADSEERQKELEDEFDSVFKKELMENMDLESQIMMGDFDESMFMDQDPNSAEQDEVVDANESEEKRTKISDKKANSKVKKDVHDEF